MLLCLLGVIIRGTDILGDHAFANIATLLLGVIAVATMAVWFLFFSGYGWRSRLLVLAGVVAAVSLFAVLFRIERLSGELVPFFAYRFSPKSDRRLQPPLAGTFAGADKASVDLRTTTEYDFPQFLGPHRSDSVEHVRLARNWTDRPPELVWRHEIGAGWSAFSVVNGHAVTMEQRGDWEMVTCYSLETGRLEWANSTAARYEKLEAGVGPRSTPTIDEGMVYALGALGHLVCLDGATGKCRLGKRPFKGIRHNARGRSGRRAMGPGCFAAGRWRSSDRARGRAQRGKPCLPGSLRQAPRHSALERRR